MVFKDNETASQFGMLDDAAFGDGEPISAHVLREMIRNGNRLVNRGGLIYRFLGADRGNAEQISGLYQTWGAPTWRTLDYFTSLPILKKPNITNMRVKVRARIDNGHACHLHVGTLANPNPYIPTGILNMTGTGLTAAYTLDTAVPLQPGDYEEITLRMRATITEAEALMNTTNYGTPNTGTVIFPTRDTFAVTNGGYLSGAADFPHNGGHYVIFTRGSAVVYGPAMITLTVAANRLQFWPALPENYPDDHLRGATFALRKLPGIKLVSVACYGYTP